MVNNCDFQITNVAVRAESTCYTSLYFVNSCYEGGSEFIYLPNVPISFIEKISVIGGVVGTNSTPISLGGYDATKIIIQLANSYKFNFWRGLSLSNNWVNYGELFETAGALKDGNNVVHLKGLIKSGIVTDGTLLTQLDVGFRPNKKLFLNALCTNDEVTFTNCLVTVDTNGVLSLTKAKNAWLSLDGLSFVAEH
jgi:hypothetical protein